MSSPAGRRAAAVERSARWNLSTPTRKGQRRQYGAVEKTRTSTPFPGQRPQRCASTNSATTARSPRAGEIANDSGGFKGCGKRLCAGARVADQPRAGRLPRGAGRDGGAGRGDPCRQRRRARLAARASAALHGRHQRALSRPADAGALPGVRCRPRRPVHLSRPRPARRLPDARPAAAGPGSARATSGGSRSG